MRRAVVVLMSITVAAFAADLKGPIGPAASYPGHITQEKITIAAKPYNTEELVKMEFGKIKPYEHGIIPVLVVIQNDTGKALSLNLKAEFVSQSGGHGDAIPPDDVTRWQDAQKRPDQKVPLPIPLPSKNKKGPLNTPEITGRAFAVKLIPPGASANGFFYFEASDVKGAMLYLTGIKDAATNQAYFYFEVPLDAK